MVSAILSIALFIGGAIVQYETKGAVTVNIGYNDVNQTKDFECHSKTL